MATHALALLVGAAVAWGIAAPSGSTQDAKVSEACAEDPDDRSYRPQDAPPLAPRSSVAPRTVDPRPTVDDAQLQSAEAGRFVAELRATSAESDLRELGGMPMPWPDEAAVPPGLAASAFEATALRVADEMGVARPEVDCGEYPCVARAAESWTDEDVARFSSALLDAVEVDDGANFGSTRARVVGVFPKNGASDGLLKRIWFRSAELGREARRADVE